MKKYSVLFLLLCFFILNAMNSPEKKTNLSALRTQENRSHTFKSENLLQSYDNSDSDRPVDFQRSRFQQLIHQGRQRWPRVGLRALKPNYLKSSL